VRLRIVHQLSLLLSFAALLAVVAVSVGVAWNLRSGFSDYLQIRDQTELDRLTRRVSLLYADDSTLSRLRNSPEAMRNLIDGLSMPSGFTNGQQHPLATLNEIDETAIKKDQRPSPKNTAHAMHDPLSNLLRRTYIVDLDGRSIAGHPLGINETPLQSAIRIGGNVVAYAQLPKAPALASVDSAFLKHQYWGLGLIVCATIVASCLSAFCVARRWSRPMHELRMATQQFANGDFKLASFNKNKKSSTEEIAQLFDAIERMAESLQSLEHMRRHWLAQISHELRTPLAVLRGELEAIHEGARKPTPEILTTLCDEVLHLTRLVNDLHILAIADLDGVPCSFDWGDATTHIESTAQRYVPLATQAGLSLDIQAGPSASVYWDFDRIAQLVRGLLDNSLRYTFAPGKLEIKWHIDSVAKMFAMTVTDSAPSVEPDELGKIFEPLFRAQNLKHLSARTNRIGSGLGLAIAKAITIAHGGTIAANISNMGGLAIEVRLPLEAR
jgi:two-component system, OmpR family, sensor histidine kinase BaeS